MAAVQLVEGKKLITVGPEGIADRLRDARKVIVDVGTGDARGAYRIARAEPDSLVVGIDPAWQRMSATSVSSSRKPERGGAGNLVLVNASIESVPLELHGIADEVLVLMPWGKLLRGIVLGEPDVCTGLRSVAKPGAHLHVTVGTSIWRDPVPREIQGLPELTPAYANDRLTGVLREAGWDRLTVSLVPPADVTTARSSWGRRLGSSRSQIVANLTAVAV